MHLEYVGGPLDGNSEIITEKEFDIYRITNSVIENSHKYRFMKNTKDRVYFIYCMPEIVKR